MTPQIAYFGAGCFWNSELVYSKQEGVQTTEVGFASFEHETHKPQVEVVKVEFDPSVISYDQLVDVFWSTHNPAARKNSDPSYIEKSVLFSLDKNQHDIAENKLKQRRLTGDGKDDLTEVKTLSSYRRAPEKDQKYYMKKN